MIVRASALVAVALLLGSGLTVPAAMVLSLPDFQGVVQDAGTGGQGAYGILGQWSDNQAPRNRPVGIGVATDIQWEYQIVDACALDDDGFVPDSCDFGFGMRGLTCPDGQESRPPRWGRSLVPPSTVWSAWQLLDYGSCPGAPVVPVLTAEEFRRLPLPAPVLHVQPDGDWVLTNIETIVYTDPTPVTLTTQVLGVPVTVEATPSRFTYAWGDGHSTVTRDPGRPYPAFDVVHEYEAPGQVTITLTTEWTGRYQVAGEGVWRDVAGTATTTATSRTFEVQERTSRLVSGTCFEQPEAPGCERFDPNDVRR